ncbi:MAG: hypothetical protein IT381_09890 [Deltaproteobacteria bacterium]|nr:hypothetical protein [Deltaproteobacteria bacterium]
MSLAPRVFAAAALVFLGFSASGCPSATERLPPTDEEEGAPTTATIGGAVTGLVGSGLFLTLNAPGVVEDLEIAAGATSFTFTKPVPIGGGYVVFVSDDPIAPRQTCEVLQSKGLVPAEGVTTVSVACTTLTAAIGGTISGLTADGLILRNRIVNGDADPTTTDLSVPSGTAKFSFSDVPDGASYQVTIQAQPAGLFCRIDKAKDNDKGTVEAPRAITTIEVKCGPTYLASGSVHGLSAATSVGLSLTSEVGVEMLTVESGGAATAFAFTKRLPSMSTYALAVTAQPADKRCTVRLPSGAGTVAMIDVTALAVVCVGKVGASFVGFERFSDFATLGEPPLVCDAGTPALHRGDCVHAGERRSVIVPGMTSCAGSDPKDTLNAFEWGCKTVAGGVEIFSRGLRSGKRLADLLDFANTNAVVWRKNTVTVTDGAADVSSVESSDWWPNAIAAIDPSGNVAASDNATIRVITTATPGAMVGRAITVTADHVIVVVAPNAVLGDPVVVQPALVDWTGSFGWFEGTVITTAATGVHVHDGRFNTLRSLRLAGAATGVFFERGGACVAPACSFAHTLVDAQIANTSVLGVDVDGKEHLLKDVAAYNGRGIRVAGARHFIVDSQVSAVTGDGLRVSGTDSFVANVTIANLASAALHLATAHFGTYLNVAAIGARPVAALLEGSDDNTFEGLGVYGTDTYINLNGDSDRTRFIGRFAIGDGGPNAVTGITGTTSPGIDVGGVPTASPLVTTDVLDATMSFVGATTMEGRNLTPRDVNGLTTVGTAATNFDWFNFDNPRRAWGKPKGAGAFSAAPIAGPCGAQCQIWDWSLGGTATELRLVNQVPTMAGANVARTHAYSETDMTKCAADFPGSTYASGHCETTIVRFAVEVFMDGVGNDNGFCESGERCAFSANLGRSQGRGTVTEGAAQSYGGVTSVTLISWATY